MLKAHMRTFISIQYCIKKVVSPCRCNVDSKMITAVLISSPFKMDIKCLAVKSAIDCRDPKYILHDFPALGGSLCLISGLSD
jgi:hypothetical protein